MVAVSNQPPAGERNEVDGGDPLSLEKPAVEFVPAMVSILIISSKKLYESSLKQPYNGG